MPYTSSPYAAKARYLAAKLVVKDGLKKAPVARMYGFTNLPSQGGLKGFLKVTKTGIMTTSFPLFDQLQILILIKLLKR